MVKSCCAYGCTARFKKGLSFFKFPKDEIRRVRWMIAVRRSNWLPSKTSLLCAKHFQTGRPAREENHPDYIPNVFIFNEHQTRGSAKSYEKRKSRLKKDNRLINDKTNSRSTEAAVSLIKCSGSDQDVPDETDSRSTEAPESLLKFSGSNRHVPGCNSCLSKDAEIYFLTKDKDELQNEIKMLEAEVQTLRKDIQKHKLKET